MRITERIVTWLYKRFVGKVPIDKELNPMRELHIVPGSLDTVRCSHCGSTWIEKHTLSKYVCQQCRCMFSIGKVADREEERLPFMELKVINGEPDLVALELQIEAALGSVETDEQYEERMKASAEMTTRFGEGGV